ATSRQVYGRSEACYARDAVAVKNWFIFRIPFCVCIVSSLSLSLRYQIYRITDLSLEAYI
ncbi:MAG: hypothetical protein OXF48_11170, partial [Bacteroidetes bacterium]|nr:hypothetical protein [Bacteroidota bacterium]